MAKIYEAERVVLEMGRILLKNKLSPLRVKFINPTTQNHSLSQNFQFSALSKQLEKLLQNQMVRNNNYKCIKIGLNYYLK